MVPVARCPAYIVDRFGGPLHKLAEFRQCGARKLRSGGPQIVLVKNAGDEVLSLARPELDRGRATPHNRLTTDGARRALTALRRRLAEEGPAVFALIAELRTPHGARHTTATTLLEATDGDVRLVQEVLGHATLETLRVYTEITDRRKRAAYQRLGEYLAEQTGPREGGGQ